MENIPFLCTNSSSLTDKITTSHAFCPWNNTHRGIPPWGKSHHEVNLIYFPSFITRRYESKFWTEKIFGVNNMITSWNESSCLLRCGFQTIATLVDGGLKDWPTRNGGKLTKLRQIFVERCIYCNKVATPDRTWEYFQKFPVKKRSERSERIFFWCFRAARSLGLQLHFPFRAFSLLQQLLQL